MDEVLYSPAEVARMLRVSERTVRRWVQTGEMAALRFGRQLRIPETAVARFGRPAADSPAGDDWLARCRAIRAGMPASGDSTPIIRELRSGRAKQ